MMQIPCFPRILKIVATGRSLLLQFNPYVYRAVPIAALICFLAWCVTTIRSDFDRDDANPEILNTAWCLANGRSIYHNIESPPYSFAAYPPVYYAAIALLMKWTGLSYLPAKLITLIFTLSVGFAFIYLGRLWHRRPRDGIWMAFLCLLIPAILYNVTRSHPQMMAVALSVWSLVFFSKNRWFPTLVVSPLLAVLAFYTKQSQIALPLAMVLYLALRNRRWLLPYIVVGGVGGLIPLLCLQYETGGYFLFNVLNLADLPYSVDKIYDVLLQWVAPITLFMVIATIAMWRRFQKRLWEPIDFYLALLFPMTIISLGRAGSHSQYVAELIIVALLYLLRNAELPDFQGRSVLKMLQLVALMCYTFVFVFVDSVPRNLASIKASEKIFTTIKGTSGPIISQQGSFALFGNGGIYIQLFHFVGLWRVGLWDHGPLLADIGNHKFPWVITEFPIEDSRAFYRDLERYNSKMILTLRDNYTLYRAIHPYYLYVPRKSPDDFLTKAGF